MVPRNRRTRTRADALAAANVTAGVGSGAQRLSLRRLFGVAHGQSPSRRPLSDAAQDRRSARRNLGASRRGMSGVSIRLGGAGLRPARWSVRPQRRRLRRRALRIDPAEAVEPGLWSASRYVWHTVDVLRFGTERLWTIAADPSFGVPTWDENVVAEVRSYDQLSPVVGLIALIAAADPGERQPSRRHMTCRPPRRGGPISHSTSSSGTPTRSATTCGMCAAPSATD